jgi:hypothetical protein
MAPALTDLLCSGLTIAAQTETASPGTKMFSLVLTLPNVYFEILPQQNRSACLLYWA